MKRNCGWSFILSNVLASFERSAWAIHYFMQCNLLHGTVPAIHSFRSYMEQITFDSSYLLRIATFLEELSLTFVFCHRKSSRHPFFKEYCIYFDRTSCSYSLFEQFFQQYVYFQKKLVKVMRFFRGTMKKNTRSQPFFQWYCTFFWR